MSYLDTEGNIQAIVQINCKYNQNQAQLGRYKFNVYGQVNMSHEKCISGLCLTPIQASGPIKHASAVSPLICTVTHSP